MGIESSYNEIIKKLENFRKKEYKALGVYGIQLAILVALSAFFIFALIELSANSSSTVRAIFLVLFLLITLSSLAFLFLIPLLKYFKVIGKTDYNIVVPRFRFALADKAQSHQHLNH